MKDLLFTLSVLLLIVVGGWMAYPYSDHARVTALEEKMSNLQSRVFTLEATKDTISLNYLLQKIHEAEKPTPTPQPMTVPNWATGQCIQIPCNTLTK